MGKIEGVQIKNFGPLKDVVMGKTLNNQKGEALGNITAVIGPSGTEKAHWQMLLDFWQIVWKLELRLPVMRKTEEDFSRFVHRALMSL